MADLKVLAQVIGQAGWDTVIITGFTFSGGVYSMPGGAGAVDSVNGQTGVVVLDAGDVGADPAGSAAAAIVTAEAYADSLVDDTAYNSTTWDGVVDVAPSKNAVRDYLATLGTAAFTASTAYDAAGTAASKVSNDAYDATGWDNVTGVAPSKNAVRDFFETLGTAAFTAATAYEVAGAAAAAQSAAESYADG